MTGHGDFKSFKDELCEQFHLERSFLKAVANNDEEFVKHFLETHSVDNILFGEALYTAAQGGCTDVVRCLLDAGYDPEVQDNGFTFDIPWKRKPIHFAAAKGHLDIVMQFLAAGVYVDCLDSKHRTPLYWAVVEKQIDLARYLINKGASIHAVESGDFTLLHGAAWEGNVAMCRLLLSHGADVNLPDTIEGMTPFHAACFKDRELVQLLIEFGADIDARSFDLETPLHLAAAARNEAVIDLLLSAGANVEACDNNGQTPLFRVVSYHPSLLTIWQKLVDYGAEINPYDKSGQSVLQLPELHLSPFFPDLIYYVLELGCGLHKQSWTRNQSFLLLHPELARLIEYYREKPRSLQSFCRITVRNFLRASKKKNVESLPLPPSLKSYVAMW